MERRSARAHELRRPLSQHAGASGRRRGSAEDLNLIYNLRRQQGAALSRHRELPPGSSIPRPPSALLILHGQEFHTSYWGHLSILNLTQHLLLPGYAALPVHGRGKPVSAQRRRGGHGPPPARRWSGYAHPFDEAVDPQPATRALNERAAGRRGARPAWTTTRRSASPITRRPTPCGIACSSAVCRFRPARAPTRWPTTRACAAPSASIASTCRRPVALTREAFLASGQRRTRRRHQRRVIHLKVGDAGPGDTLIDGSSGALKYRATLRANFPVDHLEMIWNGACRGEPETGSDRSIRADVTRELPASPAADGCSCAPGTTGRIPTSSTSIHTPRRARSTCASHDRPRRSRGRRGRISCAGSARIQSGDRAERQLSDCRRDAPRCCRTSRRARRVLRTVPERAPGGDR